MTSVQYIEEDGRRTFAIVPMRLWCKAVEALEDAEALHMLDESAGVGDAAMVPEPVAARERESGSAVLAWREHRGLSQSQLANRAGISKAYLSQIETGARHGSVRALKALARALDVPLDVLAD